MGEQRQALEHDMKRTMRLRWIIWGIMTLAFLMVHLHRASPGTVADRIMGDLDISGAAFGSLTAIFLYIYAAMQIPAGVFADFVGPRKVGTAGLLLAGIGSIFFGLSSDVSVVYLARFLVGLGCSVIFVNLMKLQGEWFRSTEYATIAGIGALVGNAGGLVATTPFALLVIGYGWRFSFALIGVVSVAMAAACWLIVRNRPADMGLPSVTENPSGEALTSTAGARITAIVGGIKTVFTNKYTWPPLLFAFGLYGTFLTFTGAWGIPYLMQVYGLGRSSAANYVAVVNFGYMIGCPIAGYISDKVVRRRKLPSVVGGIGFFVVWLLLTLMGGGRPPLGLLYPLSFLIGFFNSAGVLIFPCVKEVNPLCVSGISIGTVTIGAIVGAAVLQPLFGYALDLKWLGAMENGARVYPLEAFQLALAVGLIGLLISVVGSLLIKETYCTDISTQR